MAALFCLISRMFRSFRLSGVLLVWGAFWAFLAAPTSARAEELPKGVLDLGTDPDTGMRRFKVGLGDVFGIIGMPRYPTEAARQYLAETGEPLTVTVIQAQNPDQVFLSCFDEKRTRVERSSMRVGDYGPWESCPPERRHLAPRAGALIQIQMKKVPTRERVVAIGEAAFGAFAADRPDAFAAVLGAQEAWFGKRSHVAAAFNGQAVKDLAAAKKAAEEADAARTAALARAEAAEKAMDAASVAAVADRGRWMRAAAVAGPCVLLFIGFLCWRIRAERARAAKEREELEGAQKVERERLQAQAGQALGAEQAALAALGDIEAALRRAFFDRPNAPASPRASERIDALAASLVTAERREMEALGLLALEREASRANGRVLVLARQDTRRLVAMVSSLREALSSVIGSLSDLRAMADPALVEASRSGDSSLPPPSLSAPLLAEAVQDRYRAVLGRVPTIRESIRRFNATLATVLAELPAEGAADPGLRDREILCELTKLEGRSVDPDDEYQGIIKMLYEAKGAVREMRRLEQGFRPVVNAWLEADARLNGSSPPFSRDWGARPWGDLVADLGPPLERLIRMQARLEELEGQAARNVPPGRVSHPTDVAELSAQGMFDQILRAGARLLETLDREPETVCAVRDRGVADQLMRLALLRRFRFLTADPASRLSLIELMGLSPGFARPALASASAE